VNWNYLL